MFLLIVAVVKGICFEALLHYPMFPGSIGCFMGFAVCERPTTVKHKEAVPHDYGVIYIRSILIFKSMYP